MTGGGGSRRLRALLAVLAVVGLALQAVPWPTAGLAADAPETIVPPRAIVRAAEGDANTSVPPPPNLGRRAQSATIHVTYNGFTPQAQASFQAAVDVWSSLITSSVPIEVSATWEPLGTNVLGQAGPSYSIRNFTNAPRANVFYPAALANKLAGSDLRPTLSDITASFSSEMNWYYGTDGNVGSGQYDLESVVLHELGHGLGFTGTIEIDSSTGLGTYGSFVWPFDLSVENAGGQALTSFSSGSATLAAQIVSGGLYFNGTNAIAGAGGTKPRLYSPLVYEDGSSVYHLDETTYPAGNANSLMTPALRSREAIHSPGAITLGILSDIGWTGSSAPAATATPIPSATSTRTPTRTSTPVTSTSSTATAVPVASATATPCSAAAYPSPGQTGCATATATPGSSGGTSRVFVPSAFRNTAAGS